MNTTTSTNARTRRASRILMLGAPLCACMLVTTACFDEEGSGDIATYRVDDFVDPEITGLSVAADVDVNVVVDPDLPQSAQVRIDDNLADRASVTVDDDGVMTIASDGLGDVEPSATPTVDLTVQRLEVIEHHGAGDVVVVGIDSDELEVVNDGEGSIKATGTAGDVGLESSSDGDVDLAALVARDVELVDTDDGSIAVHATQSIEGSISGGADVVVSGDPARRDVDVDGDGELVWA